MARACSWDSRRLFVRVEPSRPAAASAPAPSSTTSAAAVLGGGLCAPRRGHPATAAARDHQLRVAAGAGLRPDIWTLFQERFGIPRIVEMYGATEGNVALQNDGGPPGSVGKPHPMLEDQVRLARFDPARGELVRGTDGICSPCSVDAAGGVSRAGRRGRS